MSVFGDSGVCAESEAKAARDANAASKEVPLAGLELESRLITHGHAVEHVARRRTGSVSLGAFRHIAKRPRSKNPCRHGRCQAPFLFSAGGHGQHRSIFTDRKSTRLNSSHIPLSRM